MEHQEQKIYFLIISFLFFSCSPDLTSSLVKAENIAFSSGLSENELSKEIQKLETSGKNQDELAIYYNLIGLEYYKKLDYTNAIESFKKSNAITPNKYNYYYIALSNEGLLPKSPDIPETTKIIIENYKKALELDPFFTDAMNAFGSFYYTQGDKNSAFMLLENSINIDPNIKTLLTLAKLYESEGMNDEAIRLYSKALEDTKNEELRLEITKSMGALIDE